ncbi:hypothetical protein ACVWZX_005406, partial [Deinococcus sp. UYEF24]
MREETGLCKETVTATTWERKLGNSPQSVQLTRRPR